MNAETPSSPDCGQNARANVALPSYRSEAKTVPNLLVAPSSPTTQTGKHDLYADYPQGYYSNGAYTATPLPQSNPNQAYTNGGKQEDQDPQEAYHVSLCVRFADLTHMLHSTPSRAATDGNDVYYLDLRVRRLWRGKILNTAPTMLLLAQLTQDSVICALGVLGSLLTLTNLGGERGKNVGAWAWGLLGRCREVGQMVSEEVGILRNLGKQSVWLLRRITAGDAISGAGDELDAVAGENDVGEEDEEDEEEGIWEEEGVEDGGELRVAEDADDGYVPQIDPIPTVSLGRDSNSDTHPMDTISDADLAKMSDADLAKAKQDILNSLGVHHEQTDSTETNDSTKDDAQSSPPTFPVTEKEGDGEGSLKERADDKAMVHATLDMLVTIIGEFYGQRDLLDGRLLWDEMQ